MHAWKTRTFSTSDVLFTTPNETKKNQRQLAAKEADRAVPRHQKMREMRGTELIEGDGFVFYRGWQSKGEDNKRQPNKRACE